MKKAIYRAFDDHTFPWSRPSLDHFTYDLAQIQLVRINSATNGAYSVVGKYSLASLLLVTSRAEIKVKR